MRVEARDNEDGSGEFTFEFDLSVPEERAGYRWFQVIDEAHGSGRGVIPLLLADEDERRVLSALRSLLEKVEPPMPEDGGPPPIHLLPPERARVRDQLIGTIRGVLTLIELNREVEQLGASGPLAAAAGRGEEHRALLLDRAEPALPVPEVARLLGIDEAGVEGMRATRRLLAVPFRGDWAYPAFQFRDGAALPGLNRLLEAHAGKDPWVILDLLLAPDPALNGRAPLEALRDGDAEALSRHVAQAEGDGFA
jgi:hypothetical protein